MEKTHKKITVGFVIQDYKQLSNGTLVCTGQEFIAGDQVDYEDDRGEHIDITDLHVESKEIYCPFEMVQPKEVPEVNTVRDSYPNGVCPDCGLFIPNDVSDGDKCQNCPHIFYDETKDNTDITDTD